LKLFLLRLTVFVLSRQKISLIGNEVPGENMKYFLIMNLLRLVKVFEALGDSPLKKRLWISIEDHSFYKAFETKNLEKTYDRNMKAFHTPKKRLPQGC